MFQNINPYLNYLYHRLSKFSLIATGLILCALILFIFDETYQQKKLVRMKSEFVEISKGKDQFKQSEFDAKLILENDSNLNLPKKANLPDILEYIQEAAKKDNILVDNISYKFIELPAIQSISYEITFPVVGKYFDIRKFIGNVSQKNSGVVLQNIELSRENNQANDLDGLLQLTIYLKN